MEKSPRVTSFYHNNKGVTDIYVAKGSKHDCQVCNMGHMASIFYLYLAIMKFNMYAEHDAASRHSLIIVITHTHKDRQTYHDF